MTRPSAAIRRQVVERARGCCEYCLVHQDFVASTHQVNHVTAEKHGGETTMDNLALSLRIVSRVAFRRAHVPSAPSEGTAPRRGGNTILMFAVPTSPSSSYTDRVS